MIESPQIVDLEVFDCRGADPKNRFGDPNPVTLDVSVDGTRRIGCTFLRPLKTQSAIAKPVYFCSASVEGKINIDARIDQIRERIKTREKNERMSIFDVGDLVLDELSKEVPTCPHKNPL